MGGGAVLASPQGLREYRRPGVTGCRSDMLCQLERSEWASSGETPSDRYDSP